jgi:NAD-dependent dihydropyrimidine dehydrogenase PreA subunit
MSMPLGLKLKSMLVFAFGNKASRGALMRELASRRRYTQPRDTIPWHPTVDAERCTGCGVCLSFCPKGVFSEEEKKVVVRNPTSCVLLCSHCTKLCPVHAISFPKAKDFRKYVYYV